MEVTEGMRSRNGRRGDDEDENEEEEEKECHVDLVRELIDGRERSGK